MAFQNLGTGGTVAPIWGDPVAMYDLSQQLITKTETYIASIQATSASIFPPVINPDFPTLDATPTQITSGVPALNNVAWATPAAPAAFPFAVPSLVGMPGPFTGVAPTLAFGTAPASFSGTAPPAPSVNTVFNYPTVVSPTLPTAPVLMSLSTINFNPLTIPTFSANVPTLSLSPPGAFSYVEKAFYTSTELTMVQTSLSNAINSGTDTGLDASTQQAISDAAYEREYRAQANAIAELNRMEALGYAFPPGAFVNARVKIQTETMYTIAGLSREIMVSDKKLRLENVNKARELAISLEHRLIDYYNHTCQRAFDAARYIVESSIAIYNAQVEMFKGQLEGYRVQAIVYDTQMKGIQAQIEELKAQIEFERTKAEVNKIAIESYSAQIEAGLATLKVYEIETEIIKTQAEVEKLKIETFQAQIQGFVGTVQAYTATVEGYKTGVEAQGIIEQTYKTSVDAYAVTVEAGVKTVDERLRRYQMEIDTFKYKLDVYRAELEAMVAQAHAAAEYNTSQVEVYKGEVQANTSYNDALIKQWEAIINTNERIAEVAIKAAEANGNLYIAAKQLSLDAAKTGAQVAAQLGAASLNAIHWSNSSSWSQSLGYSLSTSSSDTQNDSNSTSDISEKIETASA